MAIFEDDFTTNTLDEYDESQGGSRAGAGSVQWDSSGELLDVHAPNNVTVFLSRDDVAFPESGRVHMEFVVHGDYHVTDEVGVRWREDDDNWLDWRGTGDGSGSAFASSYGDQVRAVLGGETVAHERRVPGTVGPGPDVRTLEATWDQSGMAVAIDGEEAASVAVDLADFSPTTISFLVNQGDVDLHSVEVAEGDGGAERVTAKATTLTLLPGYNEVSADPDGDELNSSIPDLPILDAAFIADDRLDLPETLDDAIGAMRGPFPEYPDEEFKAYRLMNQIELSFETEDGKTINDWSTAEIAINEVEDPLTGGEWNLSNILVEGEIQHGEQNPVREVIDRPEYDWFDGKEKLPGDPKQWHDEILEVDVNRVKIGDVEGIRASFIRGARDSFVLEMKRAFLGMGNDAIRLAIAFGDLGMDPAGYAGMMVGPPYFYTFIDLVVMADDSALARVWDASPYPRHYLYVGNDLRGESPFEEGTDWEVNQSWNDNLPFEATLGEQQLPTLTPFSPRLPTGYDWGLFRGYGDHPILVGGKDGETLSKSDLATDFDLAEPHLPNGFE